MYCLVALMSYEWFHQGHPLIAHGTDGPRWFHPISIGTSNLHNDITLMSLIKVGLKITVVDASMSIKETVGDK
jgi:hypothetical protein